MRVRVALGVAGMIAAILGYQALGGSDRFFWPQSGMRILDQIHSYRKDDLIGVSERCYPGRHPANLLLSGRHKDKLEACLPTLEPVTDYVEVHPGEEIERVYQGQIPGYQCELTAAYVRYNARLVGSDCGLGLAPHDLDLDSGQLSYARGG